jgi:hypothetical protein
LGRSGAPGELRHAVLALREDGAFAVIAPFHAPTRLALPSGVGGACLAPPGVVLAVLGASWRSEWKATITLRRGGVRCGTVPA